MQLRLWIWPVLALGAVAAFLAGCSGNDSGAVGGPALAGVAVTPADGSIAVPLDGAIRLDFPGRQDRSSAERVIHLVSLTPVAGDSPCAAMMDSCCGAGGTGAMSGMAGCGMSSEGSGGSEHAGHHGSGSGGMMGGGMMDHGMMSDPSMLAHLVEHHAVRGGFVWQEGDTRAEFVPEGGLEPATDYMLVVGDATAGSGAGSPALFRFRTTGGGD